MDCEDGKTASDKQGKFLIALKCNGCDKYDENNPLHDDRNLESKEKNVEEGGTASCGCMATVTHGMSAKDKVDPRDCKSKMNKASRGRAKKEGIPYDIDEEYLKNLGVPEVCPVLGIPLDWNSDKTSDNSPSLDKFYPDKGCER